MNFCTQFGVDGNLGILYLAPDMVRSLLIKPLRIRLFAELRPRSAGVAHSSHQFRVVLSPVCVRPGQPQVKEPRRVIFYI